MRILDPLRLTHQTIRIVCTGVLFRWSYRHLRLALQVCRYLHRQLSDLPSMLGSRDSWQQIEAKGKLVITKEGSQSRLPLSDLPARLSSCGQKDLELQSGLKNEAGLRADHTRRKLKLIDRAIAE